MHGKHHDDKPKYIGFERTSYGFGGPVPDPITMTSHKRRASMFSNSLKTMEMKQFTYTGDNWVN